MTGDFAMDDYVECSMCGHAIEDHSVTGCFCSCAEGFSRRDIENLRREAGLPASYRPRDY